MPRLTEEQALAGLQKIIRDVCGDPRNLEVPQATDNFFDFMRNTSEFDSLDEVDFIIGLHVSFGEEVSDEEIREWLSGGIDDPWEKNFEQWERDVKPTLTFGRLAHWVCERATAPSFAPMNVAGRMCGPAGAFCGIEETVEAVAPGRRFPPRTPIRSRLCGRELEAVWNRLNVCAMGRLPDLRFPYRKFGETLMLILILAGFIGSLCLTGLGFAVWIAVLLPACALIFAAACRLSVSGDPLPTDIKTFRDLAYVMSEIVNGPESAMAVERPETTSQ